MSFQKNIIIIACILLILTLCLMGYMLYKNKENKKYPPVLGSCPDYWRSDPSFNQICYNDFDLGICKNEMNFNIDKFQGDQGNCNKAKWANTCQVWWTGLSGNPDICDTASSSNS